MPLYEYKVIPAPTKGQKAKGVKTPEGRFANAVESTMNQMAEDGWEFQRAELLPSDERSGLTGSTTNWRNLLVFRRQRLDDLEAFSPSPLQLEKREEPAQDSDTAEARPANGAERILKDNGVEELSDVAGMTTALKTRAAMQSDEDAQGEDTEDRATPEETRAT